MKPIAFWQRSVALGIVACAMLGLSACATRQPEKPVTGDTGLMNAAPPAPSRGADVAAASPSSAGSATDAAARSGRSAPSDMSVYFEFDSSALSDRDRNVVQRHAQYLGSQRRPVRLEGNADERGSREYNIALGQRRADAVRQLLTLQGTSPDTVEAVSYGEERPRCTDDTEQCWSTNRRVDFVYSR